MKRLLPIVAFILSRAIIVTLAVNPAAYSHGEELAADRDVLYRSYGEALVGGAIPYLEQDIEYPPGSLPLFATPALAGTDVEPYRGAFIAIILMFDALGMFLAYRLTGRGGSSYIAVWAWVLLVALLGPLTYARIDLVPAVLTLWAIERATAKAWGWSGALLALGGMVKVYPLLLLPFFLLRSPKPRRVFVAATTTAVTFFLPFIMIAPEIRADVLGYHLARGIQIESLWGSLMFIAARQGAHFPQSVAFGAFQFGGSVAEALKVVSGIAILLALAAGTDATKKLGGDDEKGFSALLFGTLTLVVGLGSVLSPQFILWLVPLAVAAIAADKGLTKAWLLAPITVLTAVIFPFLYRQLIATQALPVTLLWARNLLLLYLGAAVLASVRAQTRRESASLRSRDRVTKP